MVNLIVSGHGEIASGLKSSLSVIGGDFDHITFIDFKNDAEKLKLDLLKTVKQKPDESFLILTDLVGGSPFNTAAVLFKEFNNVKILGGVNLPMLLSIVYDNTSTLSELSALALQCGKDGIKELPVLK